MICVVYTVSAAPHINGQAEPQFFNKLRPYQFDPNTVPAKNHVSPIVIQAVPSPQTVKAIVIRVEFQPDSLATTTGDGSWHDTTYADTGADGNYWVDKNIVELANYYAEVSYGLLTLEISLAPTIYTLANNMSHYGQETQASIESLIYDSVLDASGDLDFSLYDAVFIIHAGSGQETDVAGDTPSDIWSLYYADTQISDQNDVNNPALDITLRNGLAIERAVIMPQTGSQDGLSVDSLGLFAHEFGHWLGWPDLYATPLLFVPTWDGIGSWGLMGHGIYHRSNIDAPLGSSPAHPSAWSKIHLGWVVPTLMDANTDPGGFILPPVEANPTIVKVPNSPDGRSYLLLENRQKTGFDAGLAGSGLLVWQVNEEVVSNGMDNNSVNSWNSNPGVRLVEADGDDALLEYGDDSGSSGDTFPGSTGNQRLTPITVPNSLSSSEGAGVHISGINQQLGGNIGYDLGFSPEVPSDVHKYSAGRVNVKVEWGPSSATDFSHFNLYADNEYLGKAYETNAWGIAGKYRAEYRVTAVDLAGHESARSVPAEGDPGLRCFIATAAHGSPLAPQVELLRQFRDNYLLKVEPGRTFVALYYRYSPLFASMIHDSAVLRQMVRLLLLPLIAFAWMTMTLGIIDALIITLMSIWAIRRMSVFARKAYRKNQGAV
ncbi:MAG: M6 family metalloprotease domain-containing protein [Gammaproteobacteria bacterium]|nr:M6 family metalloprotease domain-containing protein [Gammaproteobacteria bacterium]